jgi:hypothetical protein
MANIYPHSLEDEKRELADSVRAIVRLLNEKVEQANKLGLQVQITQFPSNLERKVNVTVSETIIL